MMKSLRKFSWGVILVWALLLTMSGSPAFAAEKLTPEEAYFQDLYINMLDVKNLHYDITIKAETPLGEFHLNMKGEAQEEPLRMKNDVNIVYRGSKAESLSVQQYLEEDQDKLVMYICHEGKWFKQMLALDPSLNAKLPLDKETLTRKMWQLIKSVEKTWETPFYNSLEITLNTMAISDLLGETTKLHAIDEPRLRAAIAAGRLILLAAGDLTYQVKGDKETQMITEIELNLAEPIRKAADLFLDIANPWNKEEIEAFLAESTVTVQIIYSDHNQIDPIEIPQDVRDNAKETEPAADIFGPDPFRVIPGAN